MRKVVTLFGLVGLFATGAAHALLIDFTSDDWNGANGQNPSYGQVVTGVGLVTLTAAGGTLTFNSGDNGGCLAGGGAAFGLACDGDGIGIDDDEITFRDEMLTVTFASAVDVINIYLLDLFDNQGEFEQAIITVGGGSGIAVNGSSTDVGGFIITGIVENGVTTINFSTSANWDQTDYALAAIEVSVPEPGTLLLLGAGLFAMGLAQRRRFSS